MGMDWVPAYGRTTAGGQLWQTTNLSQALVAAYSGGAGEFATFEGDEEEFFVERIVGTVAVYAQGLDPDPTTMIARILPLQVNLTSILPQLPWNVGDAEGDYPANFRFWWERRYTAVASTAVNDVTATQRTNSLEVDHPYWTQVDIRPKQLVGRRKNLWPCLTVWNNSGIGQILEVRWSLRMLLKSVS